MFSSTFIKRLFIISISLLNLFLVLPKTDAATTQNPYTKIMSSMVKIVDVMENGFSDNNFVIFGDVKRYQSNTTTDIHILQIINAVVIKIKEPGSFLTTEVDPSDYSCEYFYEMTGLDDLDATICDPDSDSCDYFICYIDNILEGEIITATSVRYYVIKQNYGDADLNNDGEPDGIVDVSVTEYTRPSKEITLNCNNFNNCLNQNFAFNSESDTQTSNSDTSSSELNNDNSKADPNDSDSVEPIYLNGDPNNLNQITEKYKGGGACSISPVSANLMSGVIFVTLALMLFAIKKVFKTGGINRIVIRLRQIVDVLK